jgi:hypothetical protein
MNSNSLARHYNKLTPWERVPLIIAAGLRDDGTERERLVSSAPTNLFHVPDFRGLSEDLTDRRRVPILVANRRRGDAFRHIFSDSRKQRATLGLIRSSGDPLAASAIYCILLA